MKKRVGVVQTVVNAECEIVWKRMRFFKSPPTLAAYSDPVKMSNTMMGGEFFKEGPGIDLWCIVPAHGPDHENEFFWTSLASVTLNATVIAFAERYSFVWWLLVGLTAFVLWMVASVLWKTRHWEKHA